MKENTENIYNWAILDESDMKNFDTLVPKEERPIQYDFSLDDFQKREFYNYTMEIMCLYQLILVLEKQLQPNGQFH